MTWERMIRLMLHLIWPDIAMYCWGVEIRGQNHQQQIQNYEDVYNDVYDDDDDDEVGWDDQIDAAPNMARFAPLQNFFDRLTVDFSMQYNSSKCL